MYLGEYLYYYRQYFRQNLKGDFCATVLSIVCEKRDDSAHAPNGDPEFQTKVFSINDFS